MDVYELGDLVDCKRSIKLKMGIIIAIDLRPYNTTYWVLWPTYDNAIPYKHWEIKKWT